MVPFARTAAVQNRAFSVVGPGVWNDLPQKLCLFSRLCTDTFLGHLKFTFLSALGRYQKGSYINICMID